MARQNKHKRDALRFGETNRVADLCLSTPIEQWRTIAPKTAEVHGIIEQLQHDIRRLKHIDITNIERYYAMNEQDYWDYRTDVPCAAPPFREFWAEMQISQYLKVNGVLHVRPQNANIDAIGYRVHCWENEDGKPVMWPKMDDNNNIVDATIGKDNNGQSYISCDSRPIEGVRWVMTSQPIYIIDGLPSWISYCRHVPIGPQGQILENPIDVENELSDKKLKSDPTLARKLCEELSCQYIVLLLALSFMSCKNVYLNEVQPNRDHNRERRRHGIQQLVKYHMINIDPMKKVLHVEGKVDQQGLKKAFHDVRGHFAHYSEERPLFGRSGLSGRFWIPQHTRGDEEAGKIVSEYRINK